MKLQLKISSIAIAPLVLLFGIIITTVLIQLDTMSKNNVEQARNILIETHQQQLKFILDTAISQGRCEQVPDMRSCLSSGAALQGGS